MQTSVTTICHQRTMACAGAREGKSGGGLRGSRGRRSPAWGAGVGGRGLGGEGLKGGAEMFGGGACFMDEW